jgi:hypothetical protein
MTSTWLVGCGRVGFGDVDRDPSGDLVDAPAPVDAAPPIDAEVIIDGPVIPAPVGPKLSVGAVPPMTTVCGSAPTTVSFELSNPGDLELKITDFPSVVGAFRVTQAGVELALPIRIEAGTKLKLDIEPPAAVIGTDVGGTTKRATFTVKSNAVDNPRLDISVAATVMGANIVVTVPTPPGRLNFSNASGVCPQERNATIRNGGNTNAAVVVRVPGEFAMTGASTANIAGGAAMTRLFRPFTSAACSGSAVIEYEVTDGANCGVSGVTTLNATFNIVGTSSCFCS